MGIEVVTKLVGEKLFWGNSESGLFGLRLTGTREGLIQSMETERSSLPSSCARAVTLQSRGKISAFIFCFKCRLLFNGLGPLGNDRGNPLEKCWHEIIKSAPAWRLGQNFRVGIPVGKWLVIVFVKLLYWLVFDLLRAWRGLSNGYWQSPPPPAGPVANRRHHVTETDAPGKETGPRRRIDPFERLTPTEEPR